MKPDAQSSPGAPRPSLKEDFNQHNHSLAHPMNNAPLTGNAFRAGMMYLVMVTIALIGELYLAVQSGLWQHWAIAGIGAALTAAVAISVVSIRQQRPRGGIRLLIGASLVAALGAPFLVAGSGLILGLGTILVVLTIALQTLPQQEANWALFVSVGIAIVAGGLDLLSPATQLSFPAFDSLILILGGLMIFVYGLVDLRQFKTYPLTTKLILAFLIVSLLPLSLLAFINDRHVREVLTDQAQQALLAAASTTAADVDAFVNDNLEAIQIEAKLPVLVDYLQLPPEQRAGSVEKVAVAATLQELQRKDKIFIDSYALLDEQGQNLIDTQTANIGLSETGRDYFQKPLDTGLPYVSPVEFDPLTTETQQPADQAALYFSSPVRDPTTQMVLGVLRTRYKTNILQKLIIQNNGLVGEQSFAILFDENYARLAHGAAPELLFKSVVPLEPDQISRLQAVRRLPNWPIEELSTNLPDLAASLDNAIFESSFQAQLIPTGDRVNLVVVEELETQPWLVAFVQSQDLFLRPIQIQTRNTLFLVIIIAGVMAAAAFVMGQFLAKPLVYLTEVVTRFTGGDLEARALPQIKLGDETGVLAASFDRMAAQVGRLLKNLEERTHELENEIGERERAEAQLQASEKKYRTLFEESKDIIFITSPAGKILDVNPAGVELSGYTRAELLGLSVQELYADEEDQRRFVQAIQQQGSVSDFEVTLRKKDGLEIECLITATLRQSEDGAILGYQGIIRDITGQKQVERERLRLSAIERELTLAQDIQNRLLPPNRPEWPEVDIVCYSLPAREMGGDFYAYHAFDQGTTESREQGAAGQARLPLSSQSITPNPQSPITNDQLPTYAIAVGDVSGKGMPAALLMAVSLASFQSIIGQGLAPNRLLVHLDRAIAPYTRTTRQNCALVYGEIIPPTGAQPGQLRVTNAGCVMPIIRRTNGVVEWVEAYGTPLGVALSAEMGYGVIEATLSTGDFVIFISDGVIEATTTNGQMFSFDRLEESVASGPTHSAGAMLTHLQAAITNFVGNTEPHDDLTIVVVKV